MTLHVWNPLEDKTFLEKLGGYRKDRRTGVEGLTFAGLMMFRTGQAIRSHEILICRLCSDW